MDENEAKPGGLFASLRRMGDSMVGMLHRRLELASIEFQEEKFRVLEMLLRAAALVVLGILTLVTATALVVVIFWDRSPVATLAIITGLYALATLTVWLGIRDRLKNNPSPFAESIEELRKDREWLREKK